MNIGEYINSCREANFIEFPEFVDGTEKNLHDFLNYQDLDFELKAYITSMLICRSMDISSGVLLPANTDWWIENFISEYQADFSDFTRHEAIKEAINLIQSEEPFSKQIIGTVYMYTVIERYAKHKLGFRPYEHYVDDDKSSLEKYRKMFLGEAIRKLKKQQKKISRYLCRIDEHFQERAKQLQYTKEELHEILLSNRLNSIRNMMLHGENQHAPSEGTLLTLLFILFHFCEIIELSEEAN